MYKLVLTIGILAMIVVGGFFYFQRSVVPAVPTPEAETVPKGDGGAPEPGKGQKPDDSTAAGTAGAPSPNDTTVEPQEEQTDLRDVKMYRNEQYGFAFVHPAALPPIIESSSSVKFTEPFVEGVYGRDIEISTFGYNTEIHETPSELVALYDPEVNAWISPLGNNEYALITCDHRFEKIGKQKITALVTTNRTSFETKDKHITANAEVRFVVTNKDYGIFIQANRAVGEKLDAMDAIIGHVILDSFELIGGVNAVTPRCGSEEVAGISIEALPEFVYPYDGAVIDINENIDLRLNKPLPKDMGVYLTFVDRSVEMHYNEILGAEILGDIGTTTEPILGYAALSEITEFGGNEVDVDISFYKFIGGKKILLGGPFLKTNMEIKVVEE